MDGQRSCRLWALDFGLRTLDFRWLGFFHQSQSRAMQSAKLGFARFVFCELDQVATLEEIAKAILLVTRQPIGALQLVQKFFRRAFWRVKFESYFEIMPRRIGDDDDERFGLRD